MSDSTSKTGSTSFDAVNAADSMSASAASETAQGAAMATLESSDPGHLLEQVADRLSDCCSLYCCWS